MANRTSKKYYINQIPNTYYASYEEVSGFFNTHIKKDHAFYINGKYHGLGFYDFEKFKLYTSFVEFLNGRFSEEREFYLKYSTNERCKMILNAIHLLVPHKFEHADIPSVSTFEFANILFLKKSGLLYGKSVNRFIIHTYLSYVEFFLEGNEYYRIDLTKEECKFIIDYIRMSFLFFLPKSAERIYFEIMSDNESIEKVFDNLSNLIT